MPVIFESTCGELGALQATLSGAIGAELDLPDSELQCESMPRPDGEGVRLRFSGAVGGERIAIIIALPDLGAGETGQEFDSNVTISVEGSGRFFSTPNHNTCWTDIESNTPLTDESGTHNVIGGLSCVGPLGEINGDGFVDIRDLQFSGVAYWGGSKPKTRTSSMPELDDTFESATLEIINDAGERLEFDVYLAENFEQQRRGLMFVRKLPERTGMLFIYEGNDMHSMWMKNTYIPLDIVFARGDGSVSSINRDTVPLTLDSQRSTEPVRYVLELNAGTTRRLGIGSNSRLLWDR